MKLSEKSKVKLEFDKVLLMLADCALTAGAKQMALQLMPEEHADRVLRKQRRTSDARKLMDAKGMPTFGMVTDIGDACERACKGATLTRASCSTLRTYGARRGFCLTISTRTTMRTRRWTRSSCV